MVPQRAEINIFAHVVSELQENQGFRKVELGVVI